MGFAITFTTEPDQYLDDDLNVASAIGRISLGKWSESFVSGLYEWDKQAYRDQWFHALQQFVEGGDRAVLITDYLSPSVGSRIEWGALYRGDCDRIYVQNRMPSYDVLPADFSVATASDLLPDRETLTEDGIAISEWMVGLRDIERFYYSFNRFADGTRTGDKPPAT